MSVPRLKSARAAPTTHTRFGEQSHQFCRERIFSIRRPARIARQFPQPPECRPQPLGIAHWHGLAVLTGQRGGQVGQGGEGGPFGLGEGEIAAAQTTSRIVQSAIW